MSQCKCKHEWRRGAKQFPVAGGKYTAYQHICSKCGAETYFTPGYDTPEPDPEHEVYLVLARTPNGTRYTRVVEDERHVDATDRVAVYGPYLLGGATGYPSEKELVDNVQVLEEGLDVDGWLAGTWGPEEGEGGE